MKAFIRTLLGYDPKQENLAGGILGVVKGYYGCVEAQGRGSLHCHMLVWVEGGLNPNEIRDRVINDKDRDFQQRLLAFLDDTISNSIPVDPDPDLTIPSSDHHPCSVRGINLSQSAATLAKAIQKDLHYLAKRCQLHSHSKTCYKYCKAPTDVKECRFGLQENNTQLESTFNEETGDLDL
jgi:Helitron helicase-like domain at N-terminus